MGWHEALVCSHKNVPAICVQVFAWFQLEPSVVLNACKAYKPKPASPKLLAHTGNKLGTVNIDTTMQVCRSAA